MEDKYNIFTELNNLNNDNFSLDRLINCMKDYSMKDLDFMKDCIYFMIAFNYHKGED